MKRVTALLAVLCSLFALTPLYAADQKPNILVIFGDDIGWMNVSSFGGDIMGVQTPNIDRIGREGLRLTSFYAQPSCTAGRAAFITGQLPIRTGLTTVGTTGSPAGLNKADVTLAEILKSRGYSTAQFGKNHLGDLEEHLPHRHGFDEFWGNLYHLNANEDLEDPDRPTDPEYRKKFDPRGIISGTAMALPRTKARSLQSAWKPSMMKWPPSRWTFSIVAPRTASHSFCGITRRATTSSCI